MCFLCMFVQFLRHRKKTKIIYLKTKPVFERDVIPASRVSLRPETYAVMYNPKSFTYSIYITYDELCKYFRFLFDYPHTTPILYLK